MTRKVVTCTLSDTVSAIMEHMTSGKFRHVPVIEENRLAGIISIGDVVKHRLDEMEGESAALRDYIRFFFSSRRRHTNSLRDWSSDVCSSDLASVPSRAILASRFLATFTVPPACFICLRRFCIWATVRPVF